ncbi:hypothetical protein QQF64_031446 [Cirrhinus molitorella]|uniref:Uncharacterized protein n=1 Tax=Cirrhinus molitorella TaxID=172907 RepID=A0ABR3MX21_9TELE
MAPQQRDAKGSFGGGQTTGRRTTNKIRRGDGGKIQGVALSGVVMECAQATPKGELEQLSKETELGERQSRPKAKGWRAREQRSRGRVRTNWS